MPSSPSSPEVLRRAAPSAAANEHQRLRGIARQAGLQRLAHPGLGRAHLLQDRRRLHRLRQQEALHAERPTVQENLRLRLALDASALHLQPNSGHRATIERTMAAERALLSTPA